MYRVLIYVIFIQQISIIYCQVNTLPYIGCPKIFQYTFDERGWSAEITLPIPDVYEVDLTVRLTVPQSDLKDTGQISLNNKNIIDDIKNNRSFVYTYKLPKSKNIPQVTSITYNGNAVCVGPEINSSPNFKYSVNHNFKWFSPDIVLQPRPININRPEVTTSQYIPRQNEYQNDVNCGLIRNKRQTNNNDSDVIHLIYSGKSVARNDHPWLAALYDTIKGTLTFFCGGNLITNKHILTAAHCMQNRKPVQVKVGAHNTNNFFESGAIVRSVNKIVNHGDYRQGSGHADISILRLSEEVQFTDFVKPICIWNDDDINRLIGDRGTIMGWGLTENGDASSTPLQTDIAIVSRQECESVDVLKNTLSDTTFCAGTKGAGPCLGDSGGGLLLKRQDRWFIRGIISISSGNRRLSRCDVNTYAVYVDTAKYKDWIIDNMK